MMAYSRPPLMCKLSCELVCSGNLRWLCAERLSARLRISFGGATWRSAKWSAGGIPQTTRLGQQKCGFWLVAHLREVNADSVLLSLRRCRKAVSFFSLQHCTGPRQGRAGRARAARAGPVRSGQVWAGQIGRKLERAERRRGARICVLQEYHDLGAPQP